MNLKNSVIVTFLSFAVGTAGFVSARAATASSQTPEAAQTAVAKRIGVIKAINGNVVTITVSGGPEVAVTAQPTARVLRLVPGEKDLKNATPIQLLELQVGDTIRARGQASDDGKSMAALEIIVITRSAVDAVSDQIRQDWQKRGIAGPVSAVDSAAGTVTITTAGFGGKKTIVVRTNKSTIVHRYAPDSAKPEDAKPSALPDISVGDQLRARGNRNADGSELAAEEIFSGTFPNFAGLIKSIDATTGTISLQDLASKKNVQLKITSDSQLHKIPAEMAQRFAMRVKAALPPGVPGAPMNSGSSAPTNAQAAPGGAPSGPGGGGMGAGARPGGGFDLQRLLDQTPAVALADLHKGDAIAVLATQGTPASGSTVIKLFSGVEPILQAAPSGSQAMMLAPWTLGGAPGGDAGSQ
jgi:hypothetical protein